MSPGEARFNLKPNTASASSLQEKQTPPTSGEPRVTGYLEASRGVRAQSATKVQQPLHPKLYGSNHESLTFSENAFSNSIDLDILGAFFRIARENGHESSRGLSTWKFRLG